ncbi:MucR family transcriptional regulator [Caulobacter sp.]|uniref:MucR family transcriptional regulator n=1 Tax=Caulobacter sp. TaxID=78 RepID=UPI002B497C8D|nr:MucR family transcriptional regulator [Caulobacter sp.]HJV40039.1 MucR family transcriptional regulator [Caulobacter sp.]
MDKLPKNIELVAEIVSAYVGNNSVAVADLPALIRSTYDALHGVGSPEAAPVAELRKRHLPKSGSRSRPMR